VIRNSTLRAWAIVVATALAAACGPAPQSNDQVKSAIEAANLSFSGNVAKADSAGMAAAYTADAMLLPPGTEAVTGTEAIRAFWQGTLAAGVRGLKLEIVSVDAGGDLAVETGKYAITDANGGQVDRGKYVVTWKRDGGAWKMYRDIWSTSLAPAAPPPAAVPPGSSDSAPAPFSS
jgi:uncharacterized protein (TIGR02246 family)